MGHMLTCMYSYGQKHGQVFDCSTFLCFTKASDSGLLLGNDKGPIHQPGTRLL